MEQTQKNIEEMVAAALEKHLPAAMASAIPDHSSDIRSMKRKLTGLPDLQGKGNKKRYQDNEDIMVKIEDATEAIGESNLVAAGEALAEGKRLLDRQQKLIRIADREEDGWAVVQHYENDALADDSDDEKAIARARREAASAKKRKAATRSRFRGNRFSRRPSYNPNPNPRRFGPSRYHQGYRGLFPSWRTSVCYNCNEVGHFQSHCPHPRANPSRPATQPQPGPSNRL
jgi:hypothetical protein